MVNKTHPIYDEFADAWQTVRDCLAGGRRIKQEGIRYLPMGTREPQDYQAYKTRAVFFNVCQRTLEAWRGLIYRNNPDLNTPNTPALAQFLKDATMNGKAFYDVGQEATEEVLSVGRRGFLVDWQRLPENRAFVIVYETEDITNWKTGRINGQTLLTLITFREMSNEWVPTEAETSPPNRFGHSLYEQYRTYELIQDSEGAEPYVKVTVERAVKAATPQTGAKKARTVPSETRWEVVEQKYPDRGGTPLRRIPFVPCGPKAGGLVPTHVPMEPIADINISHYQTSADWENVLHVAGAPTPILAGFKDIGQIKLGTSHGYVSEDPQATGTFMAYNANDASALKDALDKKEKQMAALGARALESQGSAKGQEAFQTVMVRHAGDMSALMMAAISLSVALSKVLRLVVWWNNRSIVDPEDLDKGPDDASSVYYELNTEFLDTAIDAPMLTSLTQSYLSGAISFETYFKRLQQGGVISSERTVEEEQAGVDANPNSLPPTPDATQAAAAAKGAQGGGGAAGGAAKGG